MSLLKINLHDEWRWIVGHSWSFRLLIAAATLSGAQAALPLFMDHPPLPRKIFAVVVFLIVSLAMILNLIVAERPPVILVPEPVPAPAALEPVPPVAIVPAVTAPIAPAAPAQVTK